MLPVLLSLKGLGFLQISINPLAVPVVFIAFPSSWGPQTAVLTPHGS
jgi:hypothetical protein